MDFGRKIIVLSALSVMFCQSGTSYAEEKNVLVLENECISAIFNPANGALIGLRDKHSGWDIMKRDVLGQSFELLLPMDGPEFTEEDCGYNVVRGIEQDAPEVECQVDSIVFTWKRLRTPDMKSAADVEFRGVVSLASHGLEFSGTVTNNSDYKVEYVSWPCIGEVTVPDQKQFFLQNTRNDSKELFPHFNNQHGYWGVEWPTSTVILNEKSYLQVNDNDRGFLVFNREIPKNLTITSFELIPGLECRYTNPYQDAIDGVLVRMQFKVNNCIYALPGETVSLDPVSFMTYKGTWEDGVGLVRAMRAPMCTAVTRTDGWESRPLTWRIVRASNGEALIKAAFESRDAGVDVLLVDGWYSNSSGMPVEGSGISDAIVKCHEMGLKVVLGTDLSRVNRHSDIYMSEYREYIMSDPYGVPYSFDWLCLSSSHVRSKIMEMCAGLPALSYADGYMNMENNHDSRTFACFDPDHDHHYGEPSADGIKKLNEKMIAGLSGGGEKAFFGYGFLLEQNDIFDGYMLNVPESMYPRHRLVAPYETMIAKVGVREARSGMNRAVLYRLNVAYNLDFYNDCLSDYVHIISYGQQIEKLRREFSAYIWDAEYCGHKGAGVLGRNIEWAVYENKDGKRTVVLANMGQENVSETLVSMDSDGELYYVSPENIVPEKFNGSVEVNPLSVVVVFEK